MKVFGFVCVIIIVGSIILAMISDTYHDNDTTTGNDSQTYIDRGKAKADNKAYFAAISDYDMAISLNPTNADTYYYRGKAKAELEQHTAAISDYNTAITLNPDAVYVYDRRGWSKFKLGRHTAAIVDFNKAISLDSNAAYVYSNRGRVRSCYETICCCDC